jgi:hypothetical protein
VHRRRLSKIYGTDVPLAKAWDGTTWPVQETQVAWDRNGSGICSYAVTELPESESYRGFTITPLADGRWSWSYNVKRKTADMTLRVSGFASTLGEAKRMIDAAYHHQLPMDNVVGGDI